MLFVLALGAGCGSSVCDVESLATRDIEGVEDAVDCGVLYHRDFNPPPQELVDRVIEGRECVLEAYEARRPFLFLWSFLTIETILTSAYVGVETDHGYEVRRYGSSAYEGPTIVGFNICEELVAVECPECPTLASLRIECVFSTSPELLCQGDPEPQFTPTSSSR